MFTEKAIAAAKPKDKVYRVADQTGNGPTRNFSQVMRGSPSILDKR